MRDKRESTQPNAEASGSTDVLARRLPQVLAKRLRSARRAAGLSQDAVAKAMVNRGFSWRQTTVAKSEAADRPVMFAEVVALSQIYKRDLEYFLYAGTELDSLLGEALSELESIQEALRQAEATVAVLTSDLSLYECTVGVASAIRRYRNTSDSGPLLGDLRALLLRWGYRCLDLHDIYEAVEISPKELAAVDRVALTEVALIEQRRLHLSVHDSEYESSDLLSGIRDFLNGQEVSESLLKFLREGGEWAAIAAPALADLVVSAVNSQLD